MAARGGLMQERVAESKKTHAVIHPKIITLPQRHNQTSGTSTEPVFRSWVIAAREHPDLPHGFVEWLAGFHQTTCDSKVLRSDKVLEFVRVFQETESEKIA